MELKPTLTQLFDQASQAEQEYIDCLTPAERQASGQIDAWEPKEVLSHMAIWQERLAKNITASLHGGELQHYDNYLDLNDQGFEADRLQSWGDCLENAARSRAVLRQLFDSLSEARSASPGRAALARGTPPLDAVRQQHRGSPTQPPVAALQ